MPHALYRLPNDDGPLWSTPPSGPDEKPCRVCTKLMPLQAKICPSCSQSQSRFWNNFNANTIAYIVASVALIVVTIGQYRNTSRQVDLGERQTGLAERQTNVAHKALETASQAQKRTEDLEAKASILERAIQTSLNMLNHIQESYEEVFRKNESTHKKIIDFESFLQTSQEDLTSRIEFVQSEQYFLSLVYRTKAHDYHAFVELDKIANSTDEFSSDARIVINDIKDRFIRERKDRFAFKYFMLGEEPSIRYFPDVYSPEEVLETFMRGNRELASDMIRLGRLRSLVPWLVESLSSERNINVANRITDVISDFAGSQFYPWDIPKLIIWWNINRVSYRKFDYTSYKSGLHEFFRGQWKTALEHFRKAINSDSRADISRSLSIFCAIHEKDVTTANEMLKELRDQVYNKWAILAKAKILLAEGDIKRGTELLIDLSVKYPIMEEFILMGQEVFLNEADWQLYHKRRNLGKWISEGSN